MYIRGHLPSTLSLASSSAHTKMNINDHLQYILGISRQRLVN